MKSFAKKIKKWLATEIHKNKKRDPFKNILWLFSIVIPLSGFVYWHWFFGYFNIRPSLYLTLEDAILVCYDKAVWYLIMIMFLTPFLGLAFLNPAKKKKRHRDILLSNLLVGSLLGAALLMALELQYSENLLRNSLLSVSLLGICLFARFIRNSLILPLFSILFLLLFIHLGNLDAQRVWSQKTSFDLILDTNERVLETGKNDAFLIASSSNYIFIYDSKKQSVRPVLKSQVQLLEFPVAGIRLK